MRTTVNAPKILVIFAAAGVSLTVPGCQKFSNDFDFVQHTCRISNSQDLTNRTAVLLSGPNGELIAPESIGQAKFITESGKEEKLDFTPQGCLLIPRETTGYILATVPSRNWGIYISAKQSSAKLPTVLLRELTLPEIKVSCPEQGIVGDPSMLFRSASIAESDSLQGAKFFLEIINTEKSNGFRLDLNQSENDLYLSEDHRKEVLPLLADGSYTIQAHGVDLLGRSQRSPACQLLLDTAIPSQPAFYVPSVIPANGRIDLGEVLEESSFICLSRIDDSNELCSRKEEFFKATRFVDLPGFGKWKIHMFKVGRNGKASTIKTWMTAKDASIPQLDLSWNSNVSKNNPSLIQSSKNEISATADVQDDTDEQAVIGDSLQCIVEIKSANGKQSFPGHALCTSPKCNGKLLDEWVRCDTRFRFQLRAAHEIRNSLVTLKVKATDSTGNSNVKSLSSWLLDTIERTWSFWDTNSEASGASSVIELIPDVPQDNEILIIDEKGVSLVAAAAGREKISLLTETSVSLPFSFFVDSLKRLRLAQGGNSTETINLMEREPPQHKKLPEEETEIVAFHESDSGSLFAFSNKLSSYSYSEERGSWISHPTPGSQESVIIASSRDPFGRAWAILGNAIGVLSESGFEKRQEILIPQKPEFWKWFRNEQETGFWLASADGVLRKYKLSNERIEEGNLIRTSEIISSMHISPSGDPIIGTLFGALLIFKNGQWMPLEVPSVGATNPEAMGESTGITAIAQTKDGTLWIGGTSGLARYNSCWWGTFPKETHGLDTIESSVVLSKKLNAIALFSRSGEGAISSDGIWKAIPSRAHRTETPYEDVEGNICYNQDWIDPTSDSPEWRHCDIEGRPESKARCGRKCAFHTDGNESYYYITSKGVIRIKDHSNQEQISKETNPEKLKIDNNGTLWLLEEGNIKYFDSDAGLWRTPSSLIGVGHINSITTSGNQGILALVNDGSIVGISERGVNMRELNAPASESRSDSSELAISSDGRIWVSNPKTNSVKSLKSGTWKVIPAINDAISKNENARIVPDHNGTIWLVGRKNVSIFHESCQPLLQL